MNALVWIAAVALVLFVTFLVFDSTRMWSRLRRGIRIPTIGNADAIEAAREACKARGWTWQEPVHVNETPNSYRFMTNANYRGGNCNIVIDMTTGRVKRATLARR